MKAEYSKHLLQRLILRKIDHDFPHTIFEQSVEHYDELFKASLLFRNVLGLMGKKINRVA
jgi:hypothetical protein